VVADVLTPDKACVHFGFAVSDEVDFHGNLDGAGLRRHG